MNIDLEDGNDFHNHQHDLYAYYSTMGSLESESTMK